MIKNVSGFLEEFAKEILAGIAQIILQPSVWLGAALLVGMLLNSVLLAVFGLIGCLAGTIMARICRFPKSERALGLYGFNGGLVGLSLGTFYSLDWALLPAIVLGAMVTTVIVHRMLRLGFLPVTFPFVIVTWTTLLILAELGWPLPAGELGSETATLQAFDGIVLGFGQVLFQDSVVTGLIFAVALTLWNWTIGLFAALGATLGYLFGFLAGFPADVIDLGLFGYNAVLCGTLFAGRNLQDLVSAVSAILLSCILVCFFQFIGFPALSFPFVCSSWTVLWMRKTVGRAAR